jgi:hypothetical protein
MIQDVTYDSLILVYETPEEPYGAQIYAFSYDGDNFDVCATGGETSVVFIS